MSWEFDATQHEPSAGIEVWPEGIFDIFISGAEEKPTRAGDGMMWVLTIKGMQGSPVGGKTQFIYVNHKSPKEDVRASASQLMSAIMAACGVQRMRHPGELANIPFKVVSKLQRPKKDDEGREIAPMNEFRTFKNAHGVDAVDVWKAWKGLAPAGGMPAPMQPQQPQNFQPQQPQQPQQPVYAQPQQPQPGYADPAQQPQQPMQPQQPQPGPGPAPGAPQGGWPTQPPQQPQAAQPGQPAQAPWG